MQLAPWIKCAALAGFAIALAAAGGMDGMDGMDMGAGHASVGDLVIEGAWARPTPTATTPGAAYLTITNSGAEADTLIGASTPAAATAELHESTTQGALMTMRAVKEVEIPPGESIAFEPDGDHIMLIDLVAKLSAGDVISLTLSFARAGDVTFDVPVINAADMTMEH